MSSQLRRPRLEVYLKVGKLLLSFFYTRVPCLAQQDLFGTSSSPLLFLYVEQRKVVDFKLKFFLKEFSFSGFDNLENHFLYLCKHGQQAFVGESLNGSKQSW